MQGKREGEGSVLASRGLHVLAKLAVLLCRGGEGEGSVLASGAYMYSLNWQYYCVGEGRERGAC